jgi:hypothetical protein
MEKIKHFSILKARGIKIQKKLKILWQFLSGCGIIVYSFAK